MALRTRSMAIQLSPMPTTLIHRRLCAPNAAHFIDEAQLAGQMHTSAMQAAPLRHVSGAAIRTSA
ncbi:uncharacterized protein LAESUDRAFT_728860 [Laetiporus sulphureus 93-53]|uniref:Uncharacterized protein n=1 Tax=Laetiporus sulphureus 93-53 TaxID=1314785 RepID=A0A165D026_9APHY|nr:uncharacterized protein LAESUDRAFT_728860 [Laetiporus sulphureus 93-53]KZT03862.1 hypothetical protein LAESUDRAFT_728860 [Laetiporus sulphureus 93-53]